MSIKKKIDKKFPCNVCLRNIRGNSKAVCCDFCDNWVHIKCNSISSSRYAELSEEDNNESFLCITCFNNELPFGLENDNVFNKSVTLGLENSNLDNLNFKISKTEKKMVSFLSKTIFESNDPTIKNSQCKYYSAEDFCSKSFDTNKYFSIFHLNIHSLQYHKNDLDTLLDLLKVKFDIIAISETKLLKDVAPVQDIDLPNYEKEYTPTEASKGGTLLYISNKLNYKPRKDLEVYEPIKLELTFVEIINSNGKNCIIGCIYKHHTISPKEFTLIMSNLLSKLSKEKKPCYLAGDFNMNLLQLESKPEIEDYFDMITEKNFTPLITSPTRITNNTKTLIDNILFNEFSSNIISGNLTVGISDHMPQFALIPKNASKWSSSSATPSTKYARKYENINISLFNQDLDKVNWDTSGLENASLYGNNILHVFNQTLDIHAPITEIKISKKQNQQNAKPWITNEILKLIRNKDRTYKKFIKEENKTIKDELFCTYKGQKNEITKLIRKSKKLHYNEYFSKNSTNIKKLWNGINEI